VTTNRITRYDQRMLRLMNDPRGRSLYATATRRRLAVAVHVVLTAAIGALTTYLYAGATPVPTAVAMAVLMLPWMLATGIINAATRGLLELRGRALDERQHNERRRVLARAHRTMTLLLAAAVAALLIAGAADGHALRAYAAPVLIAVLVTHWLMPLWTAGVMARDEPAEDEGLTP
jgi:membrane protein YdbS with pleckstrin-like domain